MSVTSSEFFYVTNERVNWPEILNTKDQPKKADFCSKAADIENYGHNATGPIPMASDAFEHHGIFNGKAQIDVSFRPL